MIAARSSPYVALVETLGRIGRDSPLADALARLLAELGETIGASYVAVWAVGCAHAVHRREPLARWPDADEAPVCVDRVVAIPRAGPANSARPRPLLIVALRPDEALRRAGEDLIEHTARCAGLLLRADELGPALRAAVAHTDSLRAELVKARSHLTAAQALERRSVVTEIIGISRPRLGAIRDAASRWATELAAGDVESAAATASGMSTVLEELAGLFRGAVAGAHSTVLRERGLRAALIGLASELPRRVVVRGELPITVIPEVSIAAYHLSTLALRECARNGSGVVRVDLGAAADLLTVRIQAELAAPDRLRGIIAGAAEHAAALGGTLTVCYESTHWAIRLSLPQDFGSPAGRAACGAARTASDEAAAASDGEAIMSRVIDLLGDAIDRYGRERGGDAVRAIAARLHEPVRVALVTDATAPGEHAINSLLADRLPAVVTDHAGPWAVWFTHAPLSNLAHPLRAGAGGPSIWQSPAPAEWMWPAPGFDELTVTSSAGLLKALTLACVNFAGRSPRAGLTALAYDVSGVDAMVRLTADRDQHDVIATPVSHVDRLLTLGRFCAEPADPEGRAALTEHGRPVDLETVLRERVMTWSGILRARTALRLLSLVTSRLAAPGRVTDTIAGEAEHIAATAHEFREIEALSSLHAGRPTVLPALRADAVRLLGGNGHRAASRLGLRDDAGADELRAGAMSALGRWRILAVPGHLARTVERSCEGILMRLDL